MPTGNYDDRATAHWTWRCDAGAATASRTDRGCDSAHDTGCAERLLRSLAPGVLGDSLARGPGVSCPVVGHRTEPPAVRGRCNIYRDADRHLVDDRQHGVFWRYQHSTAEPHTPRANDCAGGCFADP